MTVATFTVGQSTHLSGYYQNAVADPFTTWAILHDAASATVVIYVNGLINIWVGGQAPWVGKFRWIDRCYFRFDTSNIPDAATLISARLVGEYDSSLTTHWVGTPSASLVSFTPIAGDLADLSNYSRFGTVAKSNSITLPVGTGTNVPYIMTLNDLTLINKTGNTYLGIRSAYDRDNSAPGTPDLNDDMQWIMNGGAPAYLEVTYTLVTVATDPATNITQNSAQLNGTLTNGSAEVAYVSFDWGLTTNYTESTLEEAKLSSGTFNKNIGNNLTPDTTYHFRAKAHIGTSYVYGSDLTFRTGTLAQTSGIPIRVTSIVHRWSAGPEAVYKAEVYTGGLQSSYLPPISDKQPLPSVEVRTTPEQLVKLFGKTGTAMSQTNALFQYGVWLSQHTQSQINAIFKHQPIFSEWWAWYQVYGRSG